MPSQRPRKTAKRYRFELSKMSLFLWGLTFFLFFGWIFALGIFVGKGVLPERVKATLSAPMERLHGMVSTDESSGWDRSKPAMEDPEFTFYERLSSKREEAVKREETRAESGLDRKRDPAGGRRSPEPPDATPRYTVQIASVDRAENAAGLVSRMRDRGYPAYFYPVELDGKVFYRVRCGSFRTASEAEAFKAHLIQTEKITGLVMRADSG